MKSAAIIADSQRVISTQFDLDAVEEQSTAVEDRESAFRAMLISRIVELLNRNPERLMHILYRVDVSEDRVQKIFRDYPPGEIAPAMADLIIERQIAKAESRAAYRQ